jgi:hypothetical protein
MYGMGSRYIMGCWGANVGTGAGGELEGVDGAAAAGLKGGKSGMGKLLGGGALLNAGPAHRFGLGGELLSSEKEGELSVLSTRFSW